MPLSPGERLHRAADDGDAAAIAALVAEDPARVAAVIDMPDAIGRTPLTLAVEGDHPFAVRALLAAGADVDASPGYYGPPIEHVRSRAVALALFDAGVDPLDLRRDARLLILGADPADHDLSGVTFGDRLRARTRRFGTANPEVIDEPFWNAMIRTRATAWDARPIEADGSKSADGPPIWCADRFGQSLTRLLDGRFVEIAGEHEDAYDCDFCIYNDVFVHGTDGSLRVFGYPEALFPPTDFHSATLVGDAILVIGSLGYQGTRRFGETPVFRLDTKTWRFERVATSGENPGWIARHRATLVSPHEIRVSVGKVSIESDGKEHYVDNDRAFVLDLQTRRWRADST